MIFKRIKAFTLIETIVTLTIILFTRVNANALC